MELVDLSKAPKASKLFGAFLDSVCDKFGFDYAAYAGLNSIANSIHGHVNYPEAWKRHYIKRNFHVTDPTISLAVRSIAPIDWSRLHSQQSRLPIFDEARDFGISGHGITIPVRGPYGDVGLLSVTRSCSKEEWSRLVAHNLPHLQSAAVYMHDSVMSSDVLSATLRLPHLSNKEREVLQWVAVGKSQLDVSDILGISARTVEVHLRSARTKLSALNTSQAVGRAIALGLIYPS